jgi:hypothetical protein
MTRDPFCQNSIDENVKMLELFRIITKYRWQGNSETCIPYIFSGCRSKGTNYANKTIISCLKVYMMVVKYEYIKEI